MKKVLIAAFVLVSSFSIAQTGNKSCCSKPQEGTLAFWVNKPGFHDAHMAPRPLDYKAQSGEMITFKTTDSVPGSAFYVKSSSTSNKVIIMVHEWWGLNDYIKREAETLAKELGNVEIYAVDLYDGKVATEASEAGKLMSGLKPERASAIIKGVLDKIGPNTSVATIGWCMGGAWSFQSALIGGAQVKACVMYYGFPETDVNKMKALTTDVLYISAEKDAFITSAAREQFSKDLASLGKKIEFKKYDADHAFANPSNPKFNKQFADDAHKIVLEYLKNGLSK